jgi:signal transduction histidine kinase/CheY-like chemotaxis protein
VSSALVKQPLTRFIFPEDQDIYHRRRRQLFEAGGPQMYELRLLRTDAAPFWARVEATAAQDADGAPVCRAVVSDITQRKHKEQQLRLASEELKRTNRSLVDRNIEIQNFYHTLSHELKTPLTSAREFVSIVMDGLAGPLNETQLTYLGIAKQSCDQLRVYINDLLDVTRLETGKMSVTFKPALLGDLVQRLTAMMRPAAAGKQIDLRCELQPELPVVDIDESRILQVLTNLLNNALKFTPEGGEIVLRVGKAAAHPGCLQVSVSDTGCGIPRDQLELIFERLYQVRSDSLHRGQSAGLGLGLYICRELVHLHGGQIKVESELGQGSTFTFILPEHPETKSLTVLVIDDDAAVRDTIGLCLEKEGFQVMTASGGTEALKLMHQRVPDLVILDLAMPDLSGPDMLRKIRKEWGSIAIIVHTGHPEGDLMNRALEFSPFTLLAKPCPPPLLLDTVRAMAGWRGGTTWTTRSDMYPGPATR